jgi:hypothetical protein
MPDSKNLKWADGFATDADAEASKADETVSADHAAANDALPAANDSDGWQQYRQWISKAPAPRGRRVGIDPALYSWKGYRSWTEQIRRNWEPDGDGSE